VSNFSKLEVAWRFKTDNLGPRPENKLEGTPIMIYATAGTRRSVVALDARTGERKWVDGLDEGKRAAAAPRQLSGRGLSYWMPAQQSGSPMTYMVNGKQYIIVAVSGGNYSGEYIAFALPDSQLRITSQALEP
jgi:glucose dehydrogenase